MLDHQMLKRHDLRTLQQALSCYVQDVGHVVAGTRIELIEVSLLLSVIENSWRSSVRMVVVSERPPQRELTSVYSNVRVVAGDQDVRHHVGRRRPNVPVILAGAPLEIWKTPRPGPPPVSAIFRKSDSRIPIAPSTFQSITFPFCAATSLRMPSFWNARFTPAVVAFATAKASEQGVPVAPSFIGFCGTPCLPSRSFAQPDC